MCERKSKAFVLATLKKRRTARYSLKLKAVQGPTILKKKCRVSELVCRMFDSRQKGVDCKRQTRQQIAFLCFINNVSFKSLAERCRLRVREDLSENVDFTVTEPLYIVGMDRKVDHAEIDVFSSIDKKYMAMVL